MKKSLPGEVFTGVNTVSIASTQLPNSRLEPTPKHQQAPRQLGRHPYRRAMSVR